MAVHSIPSFPSTPYPTPSPNYARTGTRPPIYNPYDKFTQPEFDDWIGGLTGALRNALGYAKDDIPNEHDETTQMQPPRQEFAGELSDDEFLDDSFVEIKSRNAKGKARDPREGPGLGEKSHPIELLSDSEEEEEEGNDESSEVEKRKEGSYDSDEGRIHSDEDSSSDVSTASARNHSPEVIKISSSEDEEEPAKENNVSMNKQPGAPHNRHRGWKIDVNNTFVNCDANAREWMRMHKADYSQQHRYDEQDEEEDIDADHSPDEEGKEFPPNKEPSPTYELSDPWEGPRMYAEDFYSGGDMRVPISDSRGVSPSHLTPAHDMQQNGDTIGINQLPTPSEPRTPERTQHLVFNSTAEDDDALPNSSPPVSSPIESHLTHITGVEFNVGKEDPLAVLDMENNTPNGASGEYENADIRPDEIDQEAYQHRAAAELDRSVSPASSEHLDWNWPPAFPKGKVATRAGHLETSSGGTDTDDEALSNEDVQGPLPLGTSDLVYGDEVTYVVNEVTMVFSDIEEGEENAQENYPVGDAKSTTSPTSAASNDGEVAFNSIFDINDNGEASDVVTLPQTAAVAPSSDFDAKNADVIVQSDSGVLELFELLHPVTEPEERIVSSIHLSSAECNDERSPASAEVGQDVLSPPNVSVVDETPVSPAMDAQSLPPPETQLIHKLLQTDPKGTSGEASTTLDESPIAESPSSRSKRKRVASSPQPKRLTRSETSKIPVDKPKETPLAGQRKSKTLDNISDVDSNSSRATSASRILGLPGEHSSRASSVLSTAASTSSLGTLSPTIDRFSSNMHPVIAPPIFHAHGGMHHHHRPPVPPSSSSQHVHITVPSAPTPPPQDKEESTATTPSTVTSRTNMTYSSPVTRSNCRFHKISLPKEEGGPRIYFVVPGCSLGDADLMHTEDIQDHGPSSHEDYKHLVEHIESLELSPYLVGILRQLVGVDLLRENEIFYLPGPGGDIPRRKGRRSSALSKKNTRDTPSTLLRSASDSPLVASMPRRSPASSARAPISNAGSTSTSASVRLRARASEGDSFSTYSPSDGNLTDPDGDLAPEKKRHKKWSMNVDNNHPDSISSGSVRSTTNGKIRHRRSGRLKADASAYKPEADEMNGSANGDDEIPDKTRRKRAQRGIKRSREEQGDKEEEQSDIKTKKRRGSQ